ncbi:MAG: hypothetical protein ACOH2K_05015 [Burkholderiaceae bacterium]
MTADELQRFASILRWVGLAVTALGVTITFGSHYIADKILVVQRTDKVKAQERLKITVAELEQTKVKTSELEKRLAPRMLTVDQRARFVKFLAKTAKGPLTLEHSGQAVETVNFSNEIYSLLVKSGFTIAAYNMPFGYVFKDATAPWFITIIANATGNPPFTDQLVLAFKEIGIDVLLGNGAGISDPGELKIYVGAK